MCPHSSRKCGDVVGDHGATGKRRLQGSQSERLVTRSGGVNRRAAIQAAKLALALRPAELDSPGCRGAAGSAARSDSSACRSSPTMHTGTCNFRFSQKIHLFARIPYASDGKHHILFLAVRIEQHRSAPVVDHRPRPRNAIEAFRRIATSSARAPPRPSRPFTPSATVRRYQRSPVVLRRLDSVHVLPPAHAHRCAQPPTSES